MGSVCILALVYPNIAGISVVRASWLGLGCCKYLSRIRWMMSLLLLSSFFATSSIVLIVLVFRAMLMWSLRSFGSLRRMSLRSFGSLRRMNLFSPCME